MIDIQSGVQMQFIFCVKKLNLLQETSFFNGFLQQNSCN